MLQVLDASGTASTASSGSKRKSSDRKDPTKIKRICQKTEHQEHHNVLDSTKQSTQTNEKNVRSESIKDVFLLGNKRSINFRQLPKIPKLFKPPVEIDESIPFGCLNMEHLRTYPIPSEISDLEKCGLGMYKYIDIAEKMRINEKSYNEAAKNFIFMEEAAENKRIQILELKNVKFTLISTEEHIFSTEFDVSVLCRVK